MTGPVPARLLVTAPGDLGPAAVRAVAAGAAVDLSPDLLARLAGSREDTLAALAQAGPVYGVSTGMGALAGLSVDAAERAGYQDDLMLARSVGSAPWLDRASVRAAVAVRLRTLLEPEAGVGPALASALAALLGTRLHPAVPASGYGAAGEIVPLAHLGGFLTGRGDGLDPAGRLVPAAGLLRDAGLAPYRLAVKEGVAFLEGVPAATALAVLVAADAQAAAGQALVAAAAEIVLVRAPRDPYDVALARGDDDLSLVLSRLLELVGDEPAPRMLQAPVSFRVVGPAVAVLLRAVRHLDEAVERAWTGVSTSPALVGGRFLGTAGFDGFDLAAAAHGVRRAALHLAEVGVARLHRLLDPRVSGLPAQLSAEPGRQAGVVAVHKRAAGVLRQEAGRVPVGAPETSLGQEDVQGFGFDAILAARAALQVLRDVTACELVAVHQAGMLAGRDAPIGSRGLRTVLHKAFEGLGHDTSDRQFGREVTVLRDLLGVGWAHDVLDTPNDAPSHPSPPPP